VVSVLVWVPSRLDRSRENVRAVHYELISAGCWAVDDSPGGKGGVTVPFPILDRAILTQDRQDSGYRNRFNRGQGLLVWGFGSPPDGDARGAA